MGSDPVIGQLLLQIKQALANDEGEHPLPIRPGIVALLPQIRAAIADDDVLVGQDDVVLARRVSAALPQLAARLRRQHDETRAQLERDFPWALAPLDWEADLLDPVGKARSEVTHTRCLAYLFDNRASHGLGIRPLREFFRLLGRLISVESIFDRLSTDSEGSAERLRHVRVVAEHGIEAPIADTNMIENRRCDLWLELVEDGHALIVVLENKVDAGEHDDQLSSYEQAVWKWAKDHRRNSFEQRLVFLTPDGRAPEGAYDHKAWLPVSYKQLAAALAQAARDAPEPGRTLLLLYVSTLAKSILGIVPKVDDVNFVRRLSFMNEVISHGAPHE